VSTMPRFLSITLWAVVVCAKLTSAEDTDKQTLDRRYQSAVADYDAGRYPEAAQQLESLLPFAPRSYELHELLGLVYSSLSEDAKAEDHLKLAVRLKPESAAARTNLGAAFLHSGKAALALEQFQKALQLEPQSFDANHNLGELYIQSGKLGEARPLLDMANRIRPDSYDNAYDLAMADFRLGQLTEARNVAQSIAKKQNSGELQNLLGQIDEKDGRFVEAANEFEAAAHMDPSEDNLFDWGSEMLLHRTYEPAIAIFQQGTVRYPQSPRLFIGLGLALYSRGKYVEAVQALIEAVDLNPSDSRSYLFLSQAYDSSPKQAEAVIRRFRRYAELRPQDARAQYYYAMSLWKGKRSEDDSADLAVVRSLLQESIALDGSIPEVHLQLGDLYADEHFYDKSIHEYVRALELNPDLSDAHYRLGTDYVHVGQKDEAQKEFAVYQKLRAAHLAKVDREGDEVQQFVYSEKDGTSSKF
jgi:tetratricopeptide (TPR) repeat protein